MKQKLTELEKQEILKQYSQLRLIDNALMNIAFRDNNPAVEYVIRTILDRDDINVINVKMQELQALPFESRSVTMDITAKDNNGKIYNIEMQVDPSRASAKRARYHASMLDNRILHKGENFSNLPDSFIIFITDGPFLGNKDIPIAIFRMYCKKYRIPFDNGQTIIFLNAASKKNKGKLLSLSQDLLARSVKEIHSPVLKKAVEYAKGDQGMGKYIDGYVFNQDEIIKNTTIENIKSCYKNGGSIEYLSKSFNLSVSEIKTIVGVND